MASKYTNAIALRLTAKQFNKLNKATAKMKKVHKARGREDVIRHLIETYL